MKCIKCSGKNTIKSGKIKEIQRYKCKDCNFFYTTGKKSMDPCIKKMALQLYLEGLGFRSIGRILSFSHVSVYNWIKYYGQKLDKIRATQEADIIEIDEMHTYINSKKNINGYGSRLIESKESLLPLILEIAKLKQGKYSINH